jgi:DNA mismatch endonuclease, patch repair protein
LLSLAGVDELWALGLRFLVDVPAPGTGRRRRVDVLLRGGRVAVLVHGCFWHGCPEHYHAPRANAEWWALKLRSVQERDADTLLVLAGAGWLPVVVWEHEDMAAAAVRLRDLQQERRATVHRP